MRMGPSQFRLLIATVLLVSLLANLCMLFKTQENGATVVVSFRDDEDRARWEAKQAVLKVVENVDLSSRDSAKALLFDSMLTCMIDRFKVDPLRIVSNNYSLLDSLEKSTLQKWTKKLEAEIARKNSVIDFLSKPVINDFGITYSTNPKNACSVDVPEVLLVVPSAPENFENRVKVRRSGRGMYALNDDNRARLLFFVGKPARNLTLLQKVNDEAYVYGDVVVVDFVDVYRNILLKAVSMLKWAVTYCPGVTYVIRTDDDVKVDIQHLLKVLKRKSEQYENFILGDKKVSWDVVRRNDSKYYVSLEEYRHTTLPPFALGGLLGYPLSTVSLLYQAALRLKPLWLDDVFITGMCAPKVGVPLLSDPDFIFTHHEW